MGNLYCYVMKIQDDYAVIEEMRNTYIILLVEHVKRRNHLREVFVG